MAASKNNKSLTSTTLYMNTTDFKPNHEIVADKESLAAAARSRQFVDLHGISLSDLKNRVATMQSNKNRNAAIAVVKVDDFPKPKFFQSTVQTSKVAAG